MADSSLSRALVVFKAAEAKLILIALFAISSVDQAHFASDTLADSFAAVESSLMAEILSAVFREDLSLFKLLAAFRFAMENLNLVASLAVFAFFEADWSTASLVIFVNERADLAVNQFVAVSVMAIAHLAQEQKSIVYGDPMGDLAAMASGLFVAIFSTLIVSLANLRS